jgi:hypothetical protein
MAQRFFMTTTMQKYKLLQISMQKNNLQVRYIDRHIYIWLQHSILRKVLKYFPIGNMHKPIWAHKKIMIINNYITSKCHKESKMLSKPKWEM